MLPPIPTPPAGDNVDDAVTALTTALGGDVMTTDHPGHGGPWVTLAIPTRDGLHHLRRLFTGLVERTDYATFDVVVVDNASTDGTLEWLDSVELPFPVTVIANDANATFSRSINQALEVAAGNLFLVINNDVDPIHPDWLTHLVLALDDDVVATGSLLVYPTRRADQRGRHPDLSVQHAGIEFFVSGGAVVAGNRGVGSDPTLPAHADTRQVPGLTAACLLTRTGLLAELGGFDEGYVYGSEDWDLSLRLGLHGQLLLVGRSVLFHHEYGTQALDDPIEVRDRRRANHARFNQTWGAQLRRRLLLERLLVPTDDPARVGLAPSDRPAGLSFGAQRPPRVVIPDLDESSSPLLTRSFRDLGWQVDEGALHERADLAVVRQGRLPTQPPDATVVVALAQPVDDIDLPDWVDMVLRPHGSVLAHNSRAVTVPSTLHADDGTDAAALTAVVARQVARPRIAVRTCSPDAQRAPLWGDTHYANSLAAAFRDNACEAVVQYVSHWDEPWASAFDIVVHLRGVTAHPPVAGARNVLWAISHPELVTDAELDEHDLVLVASSLFAAKLRTRTRTPVKTMWQATDTTLFRPTTRNGRAVAAGIVVVANARWPHRPAPRWLQELGWDFTLHGANWDHDAHAITADEGYVANQDLTHVYAGATIVVADQWEPMAREGFVANRLFDVVASGGFVISDAGSGVTEVFGDLVPTYGSRDELDVLLRRYVDDEAGRTAIVARAMPYVRRQHSFTTRATEILDLLEVAPRS